MIKNIKVKASKMDLISKYSEACERFFSYLIENNIVQVDLDVLNILLQNNLRKGIQKTEVYDLLDGARNALMKPNNGNAIVDGATDLMNSIIKVVPGGKGFEGDYYKKQQEKIQEEIDNAKSRPISGNETTFNVNLKISGADNYANLLATTMQKDPSMKDQVVAAINEPIRSYLANA
jgi:hypothetical protein